MKVVKLSALRSKLKTYFDAVSESLEIIIVPRNNNDDDAIVIMSIREYNSLMETHYLLSQEANRNRLLGSIDQMKSGETVAYSLDN